LKQKPADLCSKGVNKTLSGHAWYGKSRSLMPVLSKFYGIVIRMLWARPLSARFHAFYDNWELVVGIHPLMIIQGDAPHWVRDKVLEWAAQHQRELLLAWSCCRSHQRPMPIAPLS
jgi:hypothetical protein